MEYYIIYNGQQVGPMPKEQLLNYGLNPNSQVWHEGLPQWTAAFTIPELMQEINSRPGNVPPPPQDFGAFGGPTKTCPGPSDLSYTGRSGKSRLAFALFALILGGLGVQYYYVGKIGGGLLCLLLTLVTCGLWEIILVIQAILVLVMSQSDFESKFVYSSSTMPLF